MKTIHIRPHLLSLLVCTSTLVGALTASEEGSPGFGITVEAAHAMKSGDEGDKILLVDVRDPVEIMFTGFTDVVDLNIPFRRVDTSRLNDRKTGFAMPLNESFSRTVGEALEARGLGPNATIITLCRTGSARGEPSAAHLRENGFPNSFYIIHGFEGEPLTEGPQKGMRLKNGWKNSGLPWSLSFNPEKIHR